MADAAKYAPINAGVVVPDFNSIVRTRKKLALAYGFLFLFIAVTLFLAFAPSSDTSSPWFSNVFTLNATDDSYRSHFSSVFTYFFPDSMSSATDTERTGHLICKNASLVNNTVPSPELTTKGSSVGVIVNNQTQSPTEGEALDLEANRTSIAAPNSPKNETKTVNSQTQSPTGVSQGQALNLEEDRAPTPAPNTPKYENKTTNSTSQVRNATTVASRGNGIAEKDAVKNSTSSIVKEKNNGVGQEIDGGFLNSLKNCDMHDGNWVRDETQPLYKPGSCSLIDEQFNCFLNGRPDNGYYKLKWKPKACTLPRLNGSHMLELLRGKRLVFVGDSLNRNMWESLICILKNSVKDQKKVYEEFGRYHFRTEASYSFVFEEYKCTVEFFVSPFLVQEWEITDKNGIKKETLRLDMISQSADKYKNADIIVFNTGHWWTHEKTSTGKDYYQEGSHVYSELNVLEAFRKALTHWGRWIDTNINPVKSILFFRGYSASHFSGGQWNSGGQCHHETEPIKNETYLTPYPDKMEVLEKVLKGMKTPVTYLNLTRMTDYRKDGHPSIYRKLKITGEESIQDCSHWCLPGVPDSWNEILYAQMLLKLNKV